MTDEELKPANHHSWDTTVPGWGEVWLRAEDATGYSTQTWLNGELLRREDEGEFAWHTETGLPTHIYYYNETARSFDVRTACFTLKHEFATQLDYSARHEEFSLWFRARSAAYAHHLRGLLERLGCE